jgi:hypothetical protein
VKNRQTTHPRGGFFAFRESEDREQGIENRGCQPQLDAAGSGENELTTVD